MLSCSQFLEGYSDYRDGLLAPERRGRFEEHLRHCPACARYDAVVGGGVRVLRSLPTPEPADDFTARLQHRLLMEAAVDEVRRSASGVPVLVTVGIALALGAAAWLPALRNGSEPLQLAPVIAQAPPPPPSLLPAPTWPASLAAPRLARQPVFPEWSFSGTFPDSRGNATLVSVSVTY